MRRTATVTIAAEGRDKGKAFLLTELPAMQGEKWAMRAFLALAKSGIDLPEDFGSGGMAAIALVGFKALGNVAFADAESLMNEMFTCVQIIPDPANAAVVRSLFSEDIEEVSTLLHLRKQVFELHTNFSQLAARLNLSTATSTEKS